MNKRKLLIGLTTAGLFSAGFGAAVFPAAAEQRTLTVTLLGGKTITVTLDVPPGTPLDQIKVPGITTPIIGIVDSGAPIPLPTPTEQPPVDEPVAAGQQQQKIKTHHKHRAKVVQKAAEVVTPAKLKAKPRPKATRFRQASGVPTAANPTFSFALPGPAPVGVPNFFIDKFRIPPFLLPIYQAAGIQYGVRWEVLAAINEIETDYGRNLNVSTAGAVGWMQFLPSTWKRYGVDANNDGRKDPYNPVDAIFSAARYLRAAGAETQLRNAVFAYNHADWYVDSVLLRARLIGGLPSDLVGSLTGLTQAHFPVHAKATYADDLSEAAAQRRVAKGHNAAVPVLANSSRRGINIYAKPGSPVIAVQDGKIVKIGHTKRLGRFVQLRDAYGNTYTYAQLKKLAQAYPQPKHLTVSKAQVARELKLPKLDPKPTAAASAGTQKSAAPKAVRRALARAVRRPTRARALQAAVPTVAKERLFANPRRPAAFVHGGQEQLLNADANLGHYTVFKSYFTGVFGLKRSDVTLKPMRVGAKVIAGTILGRIGTTSRTVAPHVLFEIRPAGRGAPRIDPKPILDGWKLLESTAIYRAAGKNPFIGSDKASIGQVLLMSKEALQQRVLADPRIDIYNCGRNDIRQGVVDRRILATLEFLSASGLKPTVSALRCGHGFYTSSGNVSEHSFGDAVDISAINGIPIMGHQGPGSIAELTVRRLLTLQGTMKPHQIISLMTFDGADNTLALADHADHIHVGFRPLYGSNSKLGRQLNAVLKPGQWIKLIDRIGSIANPTVLTKPSKYAIDVVKKAARASSAHKGE
jgi:murein DD-endopeptidase MepM/ murein hydrolase activator NlpD